MEIKSFLTSALFGRIIIVGLVILFLGTFLAAGYFHIQDVNSRLGQQEQLLKLEAETKVQQAAIALLKSDSERLQQNLAEHAKLTDKLNTEYLTALDTLHRERRKKLSLEKIAARKPKLVQNIINHATEHTFRCFELITGAERKKDEKVACNFTLTDL